MKNKVILILLSLLVSGCSDDAADAIQTNLKTCLHKAESDIDKTLCLEEAKTYRETCFNKNGNGSWSLACIRLIGRTAK